MLRLGRLLVVGMMGLVLGCRDNTPPVAMVPVAGPGQDTPRREYEAEKPMPNGEGQMPQPFMDEPLLVDSPPEAKRFVEAYTHVGRPTIMVFVQRTLWGVDATDTENDGVGARAIDFQMLESLLMDWLAADGKVSLVSADAARRVLTRDQFQLIEGGHTDVLAQVAGQVGADVLIQVQARMTRQTSVGQAVRIVIEAVNTKGDDSLARASVDMYPPLDKGRMNKFTRFVSRKLMDGMASTWSGPGPNRGRDAGGAGPAPAGGAPAPGGAVAPGTTAPAEKGLGPRLEKPAGQQ